MKLGQKLESKTASEKFKLLYRTEELLRLEHNVEGKKFKDGVISLSEWKEYKVTFFKRQKLVLHEVNKLRDKFSLFAEDKQEEMQIHKNSGRRTQELDADIDIEVIEE